MADVAIRIQEAFPGVGRISKGGSTTKAASTVERHKKAFTRWLEKSGKLEKRMESYRFEVASKVPFHCEMFFSSDIVSSCS